MPQSKSLIGPADERDWLRLSINILIICALMIYVPLTYVASDGGTTTGVMFFGGLSIMLLASLGIINIRVTRLVDGLPLLAILLVGFTITMAALHQMPR